MGIAAGWCQARGVSCESVVGGRGRLQAGPREGEEGCQGTGGGSGAGSDVL